MSDLTFKARLRRLAYRAPGARRLRFGADMTFGRRPDFVGWGMVCNTHTPWENGGSFFEFAKRMSAAVAGGDFQLTQFEHEGNQQDVLNSLMWRHYIVHWRASLAGQSEGALVECGFCDGLTAFFALSATDRDAWLYDAWAAMKPELLTALESKNEGRYGFVNVDTTRRNLQPFAGRCVFNKGYIPEVFPQVENPSKVAWLHIDLNSAIPTLAALEFFWPRMAAGGVVLFDDYNHYGDEDARRVIDGFFAGKSGILLPMPTGQAMFLVR